MRVALWSYDSLDYKHLTPEQLVERVRSTQPGPGSVALFHDDDSSTTTALPEIIAAFEERGMECVSLDALAGSSKLRMKNQRR
jgi:peptidoglycan/xylan/chitin deacetylase (PgdA/CDA1 family)